MQLLNRVYQLFRKVPPISIEELYGNEDQNAPNFDIFGGMGN